VAYRRRRGVLAALDGLLWRIEAFNDRWEPETAVPWSLISAALRHGCVFRFPCTGAMLHAAVLDRQEALMRPVYMVVRGRFRDEEGRIPRDSPATVPLREIA
jgi:hypothetical protein